MITYVNYIEWLISPALTPDPGRLIRIRMGKPGWLHVSLYLGCFLLAINDRLLLLGLCSSPPLCQKIPSSLFYVLNLRFSVPERNRGVPSVIPR